MKVGILFNSFTGNTLSVVGTLTEGLRAAGIPAENDRLGVEPDIPDASSFRIVHAPDPAPFDALVFACPVHGFRISRQMDAFLARLPDLEGKKTACFVTHAFPFAFLGGKGSLRQLETRLRQKGADLVASACLDWGSRRRESQIAALKDLLVQTFR